jgi:hypothetical protein
MRNQKRKRDAGEDHEEKLQKAFCRIDEKAVHDIDPSMAGGQQPAAAIPFVVP